MQPHLEKLIKKHFGDDQVLSPEVLALLNDLDQELSGSKGIDPALNLVLDSMPFGITLIDYQKNIIHANRDALELMGYHFYLCFCTNEKYFFII